MNTQAKNDVRVCLWRRGSVLDFARDKLMANWKCLVDSIICKFFFFSSAIVQDNTYQTISPHPSPQPEYVVRQGHQVSSELAHIDSVLRSRRMELHDVTAALLDRRKELDAMTDKVILM